MRNLIATKSLTYATRRLRAGDGFIVRSDKDAKVLIAIGKAKPDLETAKPKARKAEKATAEPAPSEDQNDLEKLRNAYLEQKGEEPDKRWGVARLKLELGIED